MSVRNLWRSGATITVIPKFFMLKGDTHTIADDTVELVSSGKLFKPRYFGKWHITQRNQDGNLEPGRRHGFDKYYILNGNAHMKSSYNSSDWSNLFNALKI